MNKYSKLLISIFYLIIILSKDFLIRFFSSKESGKLLILYYHSVPNDREEEFAWQLETLSKFGKFLHIDFLNRIPTKERYYAISFDDGFNDVFSNAIPELAKRNIPATIFFPTAYIGGSHNMPMYADEMIMSKEQILSLNKNLVKVGSHTANHLRLTQLSEKLLTEELYESKLYLETLLKREISLLSFPYGDYNNNIVQRARDLGYKIIYTTEPEYISSKSDQNSFLRGRVEVDPTNTRLEFIIKILGGYNWMSYYFRLKRKFQMFL